MAAGAGAANEDEDVEIEDEDELNKWELQIQRLDYSKYTGLRRFQVQLWLLFEDATSSKAAGVIEIVLLVLIVISTALILIKSITHCYYVVDTQTMETCVVNATFAPDDSCTRVCDKRPDFVVEYFVIEAVCIGAFTMEYLCRLFASPATIGLPAFLSPFSTNMIDLLAIAPFWIELTFLVSSGSSGSGADALAVLRIVRLTRVLRVVKKSKSLSGLLVLLRTLVKSFVAVLMIVTFAILTCIVCSSLMFSTNEIGDYKKYVPPSGSISDTVTGCDSPSGCDRGMFRREDNSPSYFANMGEIWWWCLQTLTSEGYGVPWVPISTFGKMIGVMAALMGTIVLALPIAVIGMHFDDEWSKNRKEQRFESASRVARYNAATQYGTQELKKETRNSNGRVGNVVGSALNRVHMEPKQDEQFSNQAYNVQSDLSLLIDEHFSNLRKQCEQTLELHRDKLTRSIANDLETVIKNRAVARSGIDAFKAAIADKMPRMSHDDKLASLRALGEGAARGKSGMGAMLGKGLLQQASLGNMNSSNMGAMLDAAKSSAAPAPAAADGAMATAGADGGNAAAPPTAAAPAVAVQAEPAGPDGGTGEPAVEVQAKAVPGAPAPEPAP